MVSLLAASALAVAACGGGTGSSDSGSFDPKAIFKYGVPGNPTSFDPRKSAPLDPVFLDVVYESLIKRSPAGEIGPGLATQWTFSPDNKALDLTLRQGVLFHNGAPFDSAAVVASLEAFRKSGGQAAALKPVTKVEARGPYSVHLEFSAPSGYMLNILASEPGMVVEPKALESPDLGTKPVGTGAFQLTSLVQGKITFAKFDKYWNAAATSIGGIEMTVFPDEPTRLRAVVSGQVDGSTVGAGQEKEATANGLSVVKGPNAQINGILLNTADPVFSNPLVRKAMMYAFDRRAISDTLFSGNCTPTVQPFTEGLWPNVPELNNVNQYHDVAKAKSLLAQAGVPNGFTFEMVNGPNTTYQNLAQAFQAQLAELNITAKVKTQEFSQQIETRRTGKFSGMVSLLQVGRPDPSNVVTDFYLPGGTYNPGSFNPPGVPELLAQARASGDEKQRQVPLRQIFTSVFEAGPTVIPVCSVIWVAAFKKGVTGMQVPKFGDYDFASVKIRR
jgi:ABC-type transport system substrate-binding protein